MPNPWGNGGLDHPEPSMPSPDPLPDGAERRSQVSPLLPLLPSKTAAAAIGRPFAATGLLVLGVVLALAAGEGGVRLFAGRLFDLSNPLYRFDPDLGWVYREGTQMRRNEEGRSVRITGDALGLRRPEGGPPPWGSSSVLVVGDSFTAGTQIPLEDAWPARVEAALRQERADICVVNAGVDGYDLAQEYRMAERVWSRFHPKAFVVGLYVGNDIVDYDTEAQARPPWARRGSFFRAESSYLFQFLSGTRSKIEKKTTRHRQPPPLRGWNPRVLPGLGRLAPADQDRVRGQFAAVDLMPVLRGGVESVHRLETTERVLGALSLLARSRGAGFLLVLLPTKQQSLPLQRAEWARVMGISPEDADLPQRALRAWARESGVEVVDLEPVLERDPRPASLFFRVDMHLSAAGHARVAGAVAPRLLHVLAH
jgi:lysophospholipase L1-like esterase